MGSSAKRLLTSLARVDKSLVILCRSQLAAQPDDLGACLLEVRALQNPIALVAVPPHARWDARGGQLFAHGFGGSRHSGATQCGKLLLDRGQLRFAVAADLHLPGAAALNS